MSADPNDVVFQAIRREYKLRVQRANEGRQELMNLLTRLAQLAEDEKVVTELQDFAATYGWTVPDLRS